MTRHWGPARPILRLVVLGAVAMVALAACASGTERSRTTAGATTHGTTTITFRAFTANGELTVPVGDVVRGECWTTSIAAPVPRAYRCFQGNKILDPCFAPDRPIKPEQLACLANPWSRALMLEVAGALPKSDAGAAVPGRPWAVQLSNGVRCVASTGTVPAVGGVNLNYHCADGGNAALSGTGTGRTSVTAQYAAPQGRTLEAMTVTTIWQP